jgi:FG-GAP repeat
VNGNPPVDLCTPLSEAFVDLNGDGYDDLAMDAVVEVRLADNGGVNIIYGSASNMTSASNQIYR